MLKRIHLPLLEMAVSTKAAIKSKKAPCSFKHGAHDNNTRSEDEKNTRESTKFSGFVKFRGKPSPSAARGCRLPFLLRGAKLSPVSPP